MTGLILTKLDGTARGGAVVSVVSGLVGGWGAGGLPIVSRGPSGVWPCVGWVGGTARGGAVVSVVSGWEGG